MEELKETKTRKRQIRTSTEAVELPAKDTAVGLDKFEQLKTHGIPLKRVVFYETIVTSTGEPERAFYDHGQNRACRIAKIWACPGYILLEQGKPGKPLFKKMIPAAAAKDTDVL